MQTALRRLLPLIILLYFWFLIKSALSTTFNVDDMMNMYFAWKTPAPLLAKQCAAFWISQSRPMGAVFYRAGYALFGFHPAPFRAVCFALLVANLALEYRFVRLLSGSRLTALLGVLIACFHGMLWDIYSSTGTIYDILCVTFSLLFLNRYIAMRQREQRPSWRDWALLTIYFIAAIDSKEMPISLPVAVLLYELMLAHSGRVRYAEAIRYTSIFALFSGVYVAYRLFVPGPLTGHPGYTPVFAPAKILAAAVSYSNMLFFPFEPLTVWTMALFWLSMIAVAAFYRLRLALFGLLLFWVLMIVLLFAPARVSGYVLYLPWMGLVLAAAESLHAFYAYVSQRSARAAPFVMAAAVMSIVAVQLAQDRFLVVHDYGPGGQKEVKAIASQISTLTPVLRPDAHLLVLNSPLGEERWQALFIIALAYGYPNLNVESRFLKDPIEKLHVQPGTYDHIYYFRNSFASEMIPESSGKLKEHVDESFASNLEMKPESAGRYFVRDIDPGFSGDGFRWAHQNPEVVLAAPAAATRFEMDFDLPDVIVKQTGPLQVSFSINDQAEKTMTFDRPGAVKVRFEVMQQLKPHETAKIRMHVTNPYTAPPDPTPLSFLIRRIALMPRS